MITTNLTDDEVNDEEFTYYNDGRNDHRYYNSVKVGLFPTAVSRRKACYEVQHLTG